VARALHGTILATFLDNAPGVFSPNGTPQDVPLQTIVATTRIAHSLYGCLLDDANEDVSSRKQARQDLEVLLRRMGTYFPFEVSASRREIQVTLFSSR
jgi:pre-rRNA-processing protein IPI1